MNRKEKKKDFISCPVNAKKRCNETLKNIYVSATNNISSQNISMHGTLFSCFHLTN